MAVIPPPYRLRERPRVPSHGWSAHTSEPAPTGPSHGSQRGPTGPSRSATQPVRWARSALHHACCAVTTHATAAPPTGRVRHISSRSMRGRIAHLLLDLPLRVHGAAAHPRRKCAVEGADRIFGIEKRERERKRRTEEDRDTECAPNPYVLRHSVHVHHALARSSSELAVHIRNLCEIVLRPIPIGIPAILISPSILGPPRRAGLHRPRARPVP